MLIGEVARHTGASARALRHYEQQGLLRPSRLDNGYRVYDDVDVTRAANIRSLLAAGLTTDDVRNYLDHGCLDTPLDDGPRCAGELATVRHRLEQVDELIARLQHTRGRLAAFSHTLVDRGVAS